MLKFSPANTKTKKLQNIPELLPFLANGRKVYSLDLLAGYSCPFARECQSKVIETDQKRYIVDGPYCKFRCFSASQEVAFPNVYRLRRHNYKLIKSKRGSDSIAKLLLNSIPDNTGIIRFHVSGDFFKSSYLMGALKVASERKDILFYAYTKSIKFLLLTEIIDPSNGILRENFLVTASYGGKHDNLISRYGIRSAKVVFDPKDTDLPIDHDDSHAATKGGDFALLLHGIQPRGTNAAAAMRKIKSGVS